MRKVKKISLFLSSLLLLSSNTSLNDYNFQDKVQVKQKIEPVKSSQLTTETQKAQIVIIQFVIMLLRKKLALQLIIFPLAR